MTDVEEALFDTHAHLISGDQVRFPPSPMHGALRPIDMSAPFDADNLIEQMALTGVSKACAVQRGHIYGYNNDYIQYAAARYPDQLTPVLMVKGVDEGTPDWIRRVAGDGPVGGIRLAAARITDMDTAWLNSPAVMRTWEVAADLGLPVAVIFFVRHMFYNLPALKMIAEEFPDLPIVLDHGGMPHGSNYEVSWAGAQGVPAPFLGAPDYGIPAPLIALRPCRNVFFKLTGINVERLKGENIPPSLFGRRFVDEFGAGRVMWGSDVGQTKGSYASLVGDFEEMTRLLTVEERRQLARKTAERVYGRTLRG